MILIVNLHSRSEDSHHGITQVVTFIVSEEPSMVTICKTHSASVPKERMNTTKLSNHLKKSLHHDNELWQQHKAVVQKG